MLFCWKHVGETCSTAINAGTCAMTATACSNWWLVQYTGGFYLQMTNLLLMVFKGTGSWRLFCCIILSPPLLTVVQTECGSSSQGHHEAFHPYLLCISNWTNWYKVRFAWIIDFPIILASARKINKPYKEIEIMLKLKPTQHTSNI